MSAQSQTESTPSTPSTPSQGETTQVSITDVEIKDENTALNVMVALLNTAQRRGVYTMQESAKAWDCIKMFMRKNETDKA
jgi:hypothetical protein